MTIQSGGRSVGFTEAFAYGKWLFGKKFKYATETTDGWLFFMDKNGDSLGEEQTWDEFEHTWAEIDDKSLKKIYADMCKKHSND